MRIGRSSVLLLLTSLAILLAFTACAPYVAVIEEQQDWAAASIDGKVRVLIGFESLPDPAIVKALGGEIYVEFSIVPAIGAELPVQAIDVLGKNPKIAYVELDGEVHALGQTVPWGIDRVFGDEKYSFPTWETTKGSGIAVAILDTGIDENHEDLPELAGGVNTIDDTHWGSDGNGHGTHVAGTVAALDNEVGVVGVGPEIRLYAVKVLNDSGSGTVSSIVTGIEWAVKEGIPIINMSLGSSQDYQTLRDACDAAYSDGRLLIAAAGNSGNPAGRGDNVIYPAEYDSVIAVAASASNDRRASFSSTGPAVELIAPGVSVLSTIPDNKYGTKSGTSMASPHAAGVAALAWAVNPSLTNVEIREVLQQTAEDLGLSANHQGYGLVRADLAVAAVLELEPPATGTISGKVEDESNGAIVGATVVVEGTNLSATTDADGKYLLENVPAGERQVTASAEGYSSKTLTVTVKEGETVTQDFALQAIPTYTVSGTVTDTEGSALEGATVAIEETEQSATTGSDGTYSIADVEEGTYNITASKDGYSSETNTVTVNSDTTVDFSLSEITEETMYVKDITFAEKRYGPGGSFVDLMITVEVLRSSDNQPVSDASVELYLERNSSSWSFAGTTNADGKVTFTLKRAPTGDYTATITELIHSVYVWDDSKGVTSAEYTVE